MVSLFSFLTPVYADAPQDDDKDSKDVEKEEEKGEEGSEEKEAEEGEDEEAKEKEEEEEEEEEEEPQDDQPILREECQKSAKCAPLLKHFEHCQEKVNSGKGFKNEDCVEELLMHCADECAAPKLFSKLR